MECHYDSQGEQVYSVKWYKGGLEIFRYLPSVKEQPITAFPRTGVFIDEVRLEIKKHGFLLSLSKRESTSD